MMGMQSPGASLAVEKLVVHRGGKLVLKGVDLTIRGGGITALVGANGAGKSSLVSAIAGLIPATEGGIALSGRSLRGVSPQEIRRQGVAVVPEGHRVLGGLTVRDNLCAAGMMLSRADCEAAIERALTLFPELVPRLGVPAKALSGGQKQMLGIGQAMICGPRFLLIDELSLGLAPAIVRRLAATLTEIAATGIGILLIEQFTALALELAGEATVLERGRVVFSGPADELRKRPEILHSAYLASA